MGKEWWRFPLERALYTTQSRGPHARGHWIEIAPMNDLQTQSGAPGQSEDIGLAQRVPVAEWPETGRKPSAFRGINLAVITKEGHSDFKM